MEKIRKQHFLMRRKLAPFLLKMRVTCLLVLIGCFQCFAGASAQNRFNLSLRNTSLEEVFRTVEKQGDYTFLYSVLDVAGVNNLTIKVKYAEIGEVLDACLKNTDLTYELNKNLIVIRKADKVALPQQQPTVKVEGTVKDEMGEPLPGVTIMIEGTTVGGTTDHQGKFTMVVPSRETTLVFSFIGMESQKMKVGNKTVMNVTLYSDAKSLDEVVVTGIFQRKASSFTGSAVSVTKEELKRVSNQNLFQSLKNLDPSLMIFDNLDFGSDPNKMPEMQLRGTSAFPSTMNASDLKGNYTNNPNQPLFILDGFEASVEKIFDLDMNRIESVTLLKDAAAKAIYGSKAANGVVVVETKHLTDGQLRVMYTGSVDIEAPDLTSYNLCNAAEKLEAERYYGMYDVQANVLDPMDWSIKLQEQYNRRYAAVLSGIDTDWMSKPLRNGIGHKHTLSIELGDQNLRAIADFSYNRVAGVMKGSQRTNIATSISLSYRYKKFLFRNILSVTSNKGEDSPYGSFGDYSKMNPYWSPYDEYGNITKNAEVGLGNYEQRNESYPNPLYNSMLNTLITSEYVDVTDNIYAECNILLGLKATVRFGITKKTNKADEYYPANHLKFDNYSSDEFFRKGSYQVNEGDNLKLSGDFNINFSKEFAGKHYIFGNIGWNLSEDSYQEVVYKAEGFPSDRMNNIMFARQYAKDQRPSGSEETKRDMGFLAVFNYSLSDRYLMDISYRANASSQFGKDNRWGQFWSGGLGWNMHNEPFLKGLGVFEQLKIRGSVGYTGSQNVGAYQSLSTYSYDLEKIYEGFLGAYLMGMANDQLKWQRKMDYNVGFDMNIKRKLNIRLDYYQSITDNTLLDLTLPPSTGFSSVKENVGKIKNTGIETRIAYTVLSRPKDRTYITVNGTLAHNKNKVMEISDALSQFNEEQDKKAAGKFNNKPVVKFYEGMSMNAIWAVPSLGIDPANGREIYVDRDGNTTYVYDARNQVVCGDEMPKITGNFGFNGEYKGIGISLVFRYMYGGQMYNTALVDRVENVDMNYNVDKRVLNDRWKQAGDHARYKSLARVWVAEDGEYRFEKTQPTSRFIQDRNELDLSSLNVSYDFYRHKFVKKCGMERLQFSFYMNDVFKYSSMGVERGLSYPFSHKFSFSLQATF